MTLTPEQIADEEYRAALWRAEQARRAAYQQGLWASLAGSPAARDQAYAAWSPVIEWLAERDMPDVDPEDDNVMPWPCMDETVNVGRMSE